MAKPVPVTGSTMVEHTPWLTLACHVILLAGAAMVCLPLYFAFVAGSLTGAEMNQVPFPLLPGEHFLENATKAWLSGNFSRVFFNSIVVTLGYVAGKIAISIIAAFAITYFRFPFRRTAFWLIFISLMLPVEVRIIPTYEAVADVAGPVRWLLDLVGISGVIEALMGYRIDAGFNWSLVNTYSGLIFPIIASATAVFLFRQFFLSVPDDLCEAAKLDGCGPLHFLWHILLPLAVPNIAALSIILFIGGWNQYLWPLLFTTDKDMATAIVALKDFVPTGDSEGGWQVAMAASFFVMLPPTIVILLMQRWFARGLVDSGK